MEEGDILSYRSKSFSCLGGGFSKIPSMVDKHPLDTDILS